MINVYGLLGIPIMSNLILLFISKALLKSTAYSTIYRRELIDKDFIDSVYYPLLTRGCINSTVKSYRNADFTFVRENLEKSLLLYY